MKMNPNIAEIKERAGFKLRAFRGKLSLSKLSLNIAGEEILAKIVCAIFLGAVITVSVYIGVLMSKDKSSIDNEIKETLLSNLQMDNKLKELQVVQAFGDKDSEEADALSAKSEQELTMTPKSIGTKKAMRDPLMTEVSEAVTKDELESRYKEISVRNVGKNIKVVDLWTDKKHETPYSIRILFAFNKLYYSGSMGTFVFGRTISNVYKFFTGSQINEAYWAEKCEAASVPVVNEEIDLNKVRENLSAELVQQTGQMTEKIQQDTEETVKKIGENIEKIIDFLIDCLKKYEIYDVKATADSIVRQSEDYNKNYIYACEVIQWVTNNLKEWEAEDEQEKPE